MQIQARVPKTAGKRLDSGIVRRPAGSAEPQGYFVLVHPQVHQPPGKLAFVVAVHPFWSTSSTLDLFQYLHALARAHPECHGSRQTLAGIHVHDRKHPPCSRSATTSIAQTS